MEIEPEPWLDDDELHAWRAFGFSSQLITAALDRQLRRDAGIPHSWFGVLVALSESEDRTLRQGDLAQAMNFSFSRLSHAADRMERSGWLTRAPDPDDGRATRLTLTDDGLIALDGMARGHAAAVRALFVRPLTKRQLTSLRAACTALIAATPTGLPPDIETARRRLGR